MDPLPDPRLLGACFFLPEGKIMAEDGPPVLTPSPSQTGNEIPGSTGYLHEFVYFFFTKIFVLKVGTWAVGKREVDGEHPSQMGYGIWV